MSCLPDNVSGIERLPFSEQLLNVRADESLKHANATCAEVHIRDWPFWSREINFKRAPGPGGCQATWPGPFAPEADCAYLVHMMSKLEITQYIVRVSEEMARSGDYHDSFAIEMALRHQGYAEARQLLALPSRRRKLTLLCREARGAKAND